MLRIDPNLSMMFTERPFAERFAAAAAAGFTGVECIAPFELAADAIAARLRDHALTLVMFNSASGDFAAGELGLAALPGREADFERAFAQALAYARATGCTRFNVHAGVQPAAHTRADCLARYVDNLRRVAPRAAAAGVTLLVENLSHKAMANLLVTSVRDAVDIVERVGADNVRIEFDLYHAQIMEGNLSEKIRAHHAVCGHIQISGVPERWEPDTGELDYRHLFDEIAATPYAGWVGLAYRPRGRTEDGLGWFHALKAAGVAV